MQDTITGMSEPTVSDLIAALETRIDPAQGAPWDVIGLQLGNPTDPVRSIGMCHEVTDEVLDWVEEQPLDMLVTYHPLLFEPVTSLISGRGPAGRAHRLVRLGVSLYVVHTAFDVCPGGAADQLAIAFGLTDIEPLGATASGMVDETKIGRVGTLSKSMTLADVCTKTESVLGPVQLRISGTSTALVERMAVVPGSGSSFIDQAVAADADVLVTGDVSHHRMAHAVDRDLLIIDAGHAATERPGMERLAGLIGEVAAECHVPVTRPLLARFD